MSLKLILFFAIVVVLGGSSLTEADVPKAQDIATCNDEAQHATRKGSDSRGASPIARDHSRAADARRGDAASDTAGNRPASDPQLEGMDPEGAKDPTYQAAYRTCMRKAGF